MPRVGLDVPRQGFQEPFDLLKRDPEGLCERLERPPHDAGAPEMLEITELPLCESLRGVTCHPM